MKGAYSLVSGLYVGALRKMALERQQDLHEQEEEKKREAAQMTMREMTSEVSGVSWPAGDRDRAQSRASNTGVFCHPSLPYLPHPTLEFTAILAQPTSSYTGFFCQPTLSYLILPKPTSSNPILHCSLLPS